MSLAFLYDNYPGPGTVLFLICLALLVGALFPGFFDKDAEWPWPYRLYVGLVALLGLGPALLGQDGATLYPILFAAASLVAFSPVVLLLWKKPKPGQAHSQLGEDLGDWALLIAGPQAFVQLLALYSVAAISIPLLWLWLVPLILAAFLTLWHLTYALLIRRAWSGFMPLAALLALIALGYLGRKGIVEHYGLPVPGSFWEAPEYTTEAIAEVEALGSDGITGRQFRTRIGVQVGSLSDSHTDSEGNEHYSSAREARILWIDVQGSKRRVIEQDGTLLLEARNDSVVVNDQFGKSYRIQSNLDFKTTGKH